MSHHLLLQTASGLLLQGGGYLLLGEEAAEPASGPLLFFVDWDADSDFGGTGEDVSVRVNGMTGVMWARGKDQIRQFAPAAAGQAAWVMNNRSRDYSPGNTNSDLYGLVQPGRKVQIQHKGSPGEGFDFVDGTDFNFVDGTPLESEGSLGGVIWTGLNDDVVQHPESWSVSLPCFGNLSRLRGKTISTGLSQNITTSGFLSLVLDEAGWPADERTIQTGLTTLGWAWVDNEDAFEVVERIRATEGPGASIYEDRNGYIVFENRDARTTQTRSTVSQATFTDTEHIVALNYSSNFKDTIEAAVIEVDEREMQGQSVIWELGSDLTLTSGQVRRLQIRGTDPFMNATLPSAAPGDTIQTLTASATLTSGTFKLRFREVTAAVAINWNATASQIQTSLESISTIGSGNVSCIGGPINTSPVAVRFVGTLSGQAINDLIEAVESTLNPVSAPATIEVTEEYPGDGISSEHQALRPSTALTGGGPFSITVDLTPNSGGGTTGSIAYNASAATIQTALRALSGCGSFLATGGPLSSGALVMVNMIYSDNMPLMTIGGTAVTGSVPTATVNATVTTQGGVADYVITAGSASFTLSRTSGASALLTVTAGASGVTMTGLRVRGNLVSVVRSHQVSFPEDVTDIPVGRIARPNVKPEISLENARQFVEMFVDRRKAPVPTVTFQLITSLYAAGNGALYLREVSDRITVVEEQTGIIGDFHIEQIRQQITDSVVLVTEFGCELATTPTEMEGLWYA